MRAVAMGLCARSNRGEPGFEACDDGNVADDDGCVAGCLEARCGDGMIRWASKTAMMAMMWTAMAAVIPANSPVVGMALSRKVKTAMMVIKWMKMPV